MAADSNFSNVSTLLHFDGANGSTAFTDSGPTPKTSAAVGSAAISTAQSKWGGASLYLNGTNAAITATPDSSFVFGTGDFTIEFWAWKSANGSDGYDRVIHTSSDSIENNGFMVELSSTRGLLMYGMGGFMLPSISLNPNDSAWHHWAIAREVTTLRAFKDGVQIGSSTNSTNVSVAGQLRIGARGTSPGEAYRFNGYLDDLRVTKGVARYTADFTPPTGPFEALVRISGSVADASGAPAARLVRAYREDTGALSASTTSDGTTGAYALDLGHDGAHTLVFYPAGGESLPALVRRGVVPV